MSDISKSRSRRLRSRIHNPEAQNCKNCSAPDSQGPMVECGTCESWFHFTCVGVSQDVENVDWHCSTCVIQLQEVHNSKSKNNSQHNTAPSADLELPPKGATLETPKVPRGICIRVPSTKSKNSKSSQGNSSKTTSSAKMVKMQLKRLEEERKLQEKRDRDYIDKKYAILEQLNSDDELDSTSVECVDKNRVKEWVNKTTFPDERPGRKGKNIPFDFYDSWLGSLPRDREKFKTQGDAEGEVSINKSQIAARQVMSKDQLIFSGNPEEWPLFISWWKNSTHACGFSSYENMIRLQRCLRGKALEAVRFRLLHPDQVDQVISTLTMLFGRPEIIINSLLGKIRNSPGPKYEKLETMVNFSLEVDNMCRTMEVTGLSTYLNNPSLLQELVDKLPVQIKLNWGVFKQTVSCVDLSVFNDWLAQLAKAASEVTLTIPSSLEQMTNRKTKAIVNIHKETKPQDEKRCPACNHDCKMLSSCGQFLKMSLEDRWKIVKRNYICRTCLRRHGSRRCLSSQLCGIDGCTYRHNALLHKNEAQLNVRSNGGISTSQSQPSTSRGIQSNVYYSGTTLRPDVSSILFKIIPVKLHYDKKSIDTYAFIDDGSSVTLIDEELAFALNAKGDNDPLCLRWTANTHRLEESSMRITFEISAQGTNQKFSLPNTHTVRSLELPRQSVDTCSLMQQYSHLRGLPIKSYWNAKPQILLGLQHCKLGIPLKTREGNGSQPVAIKTRLGWALFGAVSAGVETTNNSDANVNIHLCDCQNKIDSKIHETVKHYFTLESLGTKPIKQKLLSDEDYKAVQILDEKTVFLGDRYAVPLLWKYQNISLPSTKAMAENRLHCLEKRLSNQPLLLKRLSDQIEDYVRKGYARKLNLDEVNSITSRTWYLPIFPVINPNKPEKVRIVWDAAAKVKGMSLNSFLMTGPDNVPELPSVLFRFRERRFAISGDIREMFHQIKILDDDKDAQRFLWRNTETGIIEVYQMQVMTFGSTCSPFCAQYIKNKNARKFEMQYPIASKAIIENHYVDDFLDSAETEEEAINLAKEVIFIHKQAGFEIRNFVSNSTCVLNALMPSQTSRSSKPFTDNIQNEFEKLLGMWWSPVTDMFIYTFKCNKMHQDVMNGTRVPTKRETLRALMCIFDPLGLIANFTIHLKIILQEVWRSGVDWDERIKEKQFERWKTWLDLIPKIKNVSINRRYLNNLRFGDGSCVQLHIFVDASEEAIAAVAYVRVSNENAVECSLICAKTKVAPIKTLSIPRLELEAAVLGVRLSSYIRNGHTIHFDSLNFWTDSQVVLSWIKSSSKKYKSFVAVRIGEILENSETSNWSWVPSKENVADDASKYKFSYDFSSSGRWYTGPTLLYQNPLIFPKNKSKIVTTEEGNEEVKECYTHIRAKCCPHIVDYNRFSRWKRLIRTIMYILRFVKLFVLKWRKKESPTVLILDDKEAAARFLYKQCQKESFPDDIAVLTSQKVAQICKSSPLYKLSPYIDEKGVIRIGGRIDAIESVPLETKRPIILPKDHYITGLIVYEYHIKFHHMFNETVVNELRQQYFIPSLRRVLKKIQQRCQYCKNKRAVPQPPSMAELPHARLQPYMRPFSYTGVDYFGPLYVKIGRRLDKRWGMLLTCLTVRAIHIEIVHSLSSDSCILGLKRFVSRRGMPKEVYSDNGTNFRGASKELQQAIRDLNKNALAREFELELKWNFIPPSAPHMGGSWERMVRSVKQTFAEITPTSNPSEELLLSMMAEVESIVNSRPLTYVPIDCENSEAITPNHFLMGCPNRECLSKESLDDGHAIRRNWLTAEKYAKTFWHRWIREYLPDLTRRTKWFKPFKQLKEGDIVIIVDPDNPRKTWPKGKILKVLPGRDGIVRSAVVQTSAGIYTRPAVKLAVLDVGKFEEDGSLSPLTQLPGGSVSELGFTESSNLTSITRQLKP